METSAFKYDFKILVVVVILAQAFHITLVTRYFVTLFSNTLNLYPLDSVIGLPNTYPLDSDLSG